MKTLLTIILTFALFACKNDLKETPARVLEPTSKKVTESIDTTFQNTKEDVELNKQQSIIIKQKKFVSQPDEKKQLEELLIEKTYIKEEDLFVINFKYPLLNQELKESYANFNEYINDYYVDITGTEAGILEDKELICDSIKTNRFREKRLIDYKVYNLNDQLVSILFYKENFYSGTLHPTYSFDCMNFDLNRSVFMNYDDFFIEGSEEELRKILNEEISSKIYAGEMYYDCWEISSDDFFEYKDNFVLDDYKIEYYFDDCVVCPSYTGSYSVEVPLENLLPVLKKYHLNPLIF